MLRRIKNHKEFIGQVGTIISGRSISAVLGLLVTPIVARLFSPSDFGVTASFLGLAGIGAQVASLRYESAVVLPKSDHEALLLTTLAYRILPAFCLLLLGIIALMDATGIRWSALDLLGVWTWMLPITVLFMDAQDIQETWLSRKKQFGVISKSVMAETAVGSVARIGFGVLEGSSVHGLIIGQLVGVVTRLVIQGRAATDTFWAMFRGITWQSLRDIARRYSDFPRLNAPASLIFSTGQNLPVLMFGVMFSPAIAGYFAMANRLVRVPVQVVAISVRGVYLQKAATIHNDGRSLRRSYVLTTLGLFAMGAVPCVAVWLYGQPLLSWLLGGKWHTAGRYLEIIVPWVLLTWATAPCNSIFIVLRKQTYWLVLQAITTIVRLAAFAIGFAFELGAERTLELFVLFATVGSLATIALTFSLTSRKKLKRVGSSTMIQDQEERIPE